MKHKGYLIGATYVLSIVLLGVGVTAQLYPEQEVGEGKGLLLAGIVGAILTILVNLGAIIVLKGSKVAGFILIALALAIAIFDTLSYGLIGSL